MPLAGPGWYVNTSVLHDPGQIVDRYAARIEVFVLTEAIARCPVGWRWWGPTRLKYGQMKLEHHGEVRRTGLHVTEIEISNSAHYAAFVHEGTSPAGIVAKYGKPMKFSVAGQVFTKDVVRGQRAQPWLESAMQSGLRRFAR